MTTEEQQYTRIIEQNDAHAAQYADECARVEAHREYIRAQSPTIRDEFAKAALTGLLAANSERGLTANTALMAERAYAIADAMLEERVK